MADSPKKKRAKVDEVVSNEVDDELDSLEDAAVGQIIQGEDGEYYVLVNDDGTGTDGIDELQNVQVVVGEDGTETLVLENGQVAAVHEGEDGQQYIIQNEPHHDREVTTSGEVHGHVGRTVLAETEDGRYEVVQLVDEDDEDEPLAVGAMATAETGDEHGTITVLEPIPQGMKMRRNRVYGTCRCPECGQSFVNTARLERHLAVHQVFGSYLCPLCGKTYKYEYNLFYHWRRTCRDLNELMPIDERKTMDVNALRQLVDEVAQKKAELGPLEMGLSRHPLSHPNAPLSRIEVPAGRRGNACSECGVVVLAAHMDRHMAIHRGEVEVDTRGVCGGFYCDLCGLMFRQHFNLIKHWRSSCPEIQAQLPEDIELTMDDDTLKRMVQDLLSKRRGDEDFGEHTAPLHPKTILSAPSPKTALSTSAPEKLAVEPKSEKRDGPKKQTEANKSPVTPGVQTRRSTRLAATEPQSENNAEEPVDVTTVEQRKQGHDQSGASGMEGDGEEEGEAHEPGQLLNADREHPTPEEEEEMRRLREEEEDADEALMDEQWAAAQGIVFADDYMDEDQQFVIREDGTLGPLGLPNAQARAKWSMMGGPVQCPECFRSFANAGRLERHLAGFHASYGTHHCILCGNRFKYDYNLLYHYRRSCPYTKAFIDRDVREQMDAPSLRKLVRNLAQKEVRLTPQVQPPPRLPTKRDQPIPKPRLAMRYPSNQPPAHLLMPRPGLPEGKTCPVCGIIFYGTGAVDRHMKAAHPQEWDEWEAAGGLPDEAQFMEEHMETMAREEQRKAAHEPVEPEEPEEVEPPPMLVPEEPGEQPLPRNNEVVREDEDDEDQQHMQIDVVEDVQGLIDSGQLQVQDGDQIILVEAVDEDMQQMVEGDDHGQMDEEHMMHAYAQPPVRRRQPRIQSPRKAAVQQPLPAEDAGLEVAAILTEMKTEAAVARSPRRSGRKGQDAQLEDVMTAQFEEELDVGSHTVAEAPPAASGKADVSKKRGRPRSSGVATSPTKAPPSPERPSASDSTPSVQQQGDAAGSATRRSARRAAADGTPWKTRSRFGD